MFCRPAGLIRRGGTRQERNAWRPALREEQGAPRRMPLRGMGGFTDFCVRLYLGTH
jgi:hypothetical protein